MKNKPSSPGPSSKEALTGILFFLVLLLLPGNLYLFFKAPAPGLVAEMGSERLYRNQLSSQTLRVAEHNEAVAYSIIENEAENWAMSVLIAREAKKAGKTPEQLSNEINNVPVATDAEAQRRYAQSPSADTRPYPGVLNEIKGQILWERIAAARKDFASKHPSKNKMRMAIPRPKTAAPITQALHFPAYLPPSPSDLNGGLVVGPPSRGSAQAPLVLEIFSDFLCPFSRKFSETMRQLESLYPNSLRVVYRHFPLPMHPGADRLAEVSACAQEQGRFWEMHDALMKWSGPFYQPQAESLAKGIGLAMPEFSACVSTGKYREFVAQEVRSGQSRGVSSTPVFFLNGRKTAGAMTAEQVKPLINWFIDPQGAYPGKASAPPKEPAAKPGNPGPVDTKPVEFPKDWLSSGPSRGPADAPVTLIEFVDYNCPFCQRGAQAVGPLLLATKIPIRFLSKQYPLSMHPNAEKASVAALCADEQGKYWEYRDEIFGASWGKQQVGDLKAAASKIGLNQSSFDTCLDGSKTLERVKKDMAVAAGAGVTGTPTFFVNGRRVVGANPAQLGQFIEEAAAPQKK